MIRRTMISVLLVDDDPQILNVTSLYLQKGNEFSVTTCGGASEALDLLEGRPFDAIISDYEMPGMDGIAFLKVVRGRGDTTPFIIFTGRGREDVAIEALNNGANFYLQKGGDPKSQFAELKNMVRQAVQKTRAEGALRMSEARYRAVVESQTELISRFRPDGTQVFANEAFCRYYGKEPDEIIGKRYLPKVPGEERDLLEEHFRRLSPEHPVGSIEHRVVLENGEVRWQQWVDRAIFDREDALIEYQSVGRDTTDRRRAEEALKDSEMRFKVISEQSPVGIYILLDGRFTYVNPRFAAIFGYTAGEIAAGMHLLDIVHPGDRERVRERLRERERGSTEAYEFVGVRRDGQTITAEVRGSVAMIGGARVIVGTLQDVSERKGMEDALTEKVNYVQALMDAIPAPVFYRDTSGVYRDCNRAFEDLTGRSRYEIIGREIRDFFPAEYADVYREKDRLIVERPHLQRYEFAITDRDGKRRDVLFSKTALFDSGGAVSGIVGVILDISERKRMEQALRESEMKYRTIADFTYDWEAWIGPAGRYIYVSPSCERITGYPAGAFIDDPALQIRIAHPDDRAVVERHYSQGLHDNEGVCHIEYRIVTKGGEVRWISHYCQPVFREDGTYMGRRENKRDVTARKHAEETLKRANEKLNLLSNITRHDVLNRLTALLAYLEFLRDSGLDAEASALIDKAEDAANVIRRQISFTRDYQEIGVHSPSWQDVRRLVRNASMTMHRPEIVVENRTEGAFVYADPLLEQVFTNLIDNAVRHGGTVSWIGFSLREEGDSLVIVCEDDGVGVEEEEKVKIFRRGVGKNTGYGLFLAREILAITGLSIREVGIPGQGARFEIVAPRGTYRLERAPGDRERRGGAASSTT